MLIYLAQIDFDALRKTFPGESLPAITGLTIGDLITPLLPFIFVLAGLIFFVYLIIGGFELLTSAGDPKKIESAQGKITSAIIGFFIIFASYWIVQILEIVFGITILG